MDLRDIRSKLWKLSPISPSHFARRRTGTHEGWGRCPFLIVGSRMNWALLVRRTAIIIGAAFVVSAIVYLVAKLGILVFNSGIT
jgi:hypothetical protein